MPIIGMETVSASLEDVFLNLTRENAKASAKASRKKGN